MNEAGAIEFLPAAPYLGLDNIDLRERVAHDFGGEWGRNLAMASITQAGEPWHREGHHRRGGPACCAARTPRRRERS